MLSIIFDKFASHLDSCDASLTYLESVGCGSISMGSCEIARAITSTYPNQTRTYNKSEDISKIVGNDIVEFANKCGIIRIDEKGCLATTIEGHNAFVESFSLAGGEFAEGLITTLRNEVEGVQMSDIALRNELRPFFHKVDVLFEMWDQSKLSRFELNSTGMAIAHASLSRAINFDASIDIWIN